MEIVKRKEPAEEWLKEKLPPVHREKPFFQDNLEYLEALVVEAKARMAVACLREKNSFDSFGPSTEDQHAPTDNTNHPGQKGSLYPEFFQGKVTLSTMEGFLEKVAEENKGKIKNSLGMGIQFPLEHLCSSFGLDLFERTVLVILTAKTVGKGVEDFLNQFIEGGWASPKGGMEIETLLTIIRPGFRERFLNQKYFSQTGTLVKEEIISLEGVKRNIQVSGILNTPVFLSDWALRYILGDRNSYGFSCSFITRDRKPIAWDRVILPEKIKTEIIKLAENYSREKDRTKETALTQFYGYGKGLTFLFSGPSGTGKTMLAHALAHKLNKDLLSLNLTAVYGREDLTFEDAIRAIFREAKLSEGIVFFDECDDLFREDSVQSRILLIEIEKADCITILATNEANELDPALDRRIIMQVPFYLPDEIQREEIWKASLPPGVVLGKDVDLKHLAKKYFFSGGLIKNTLLMAIQNGLPHNGGASLLLTRGELEKTADWQTNRMLETKGVETIYQPKVNLEELPIRFQERKWFQRLVSLYKKTRRENQSGLSFVIGSSDLQTGISCVEGVAAGCQLKMRCFSFSNILWNRHEFVLIDKRSRHRSRDLVEYAFKFSLGQESLLLFTDFQGDFGKHVEKKEETERGDFLKFLDQLRNFPGMFFLVTKPIQKGNLPIEFHHYLELKPPREDLQLQHWEAHLSGKGYNQEELLDLIERYPLHFPEIDTVARLARINGLLQGKEASPDLSHVFSTIGRMKRKGATPILFGPKSSFKKI